MTSAGTPSLKAGQGRELIEQALPYQLRAKTTYTFTPDGVHCTISLPVSATKKRTLNLTEQTLSNHRILVVEDEYLPAMVLQRMLQELGAIVLGPVARLGDALEMIRSEPSIDAAVLDINLGGETAFPAADLLMEQGVPFVFTTGYDETATPERFASTVTLQKPIDISRIVTILAKVI
ncbi:response regulator [Paracoccus aerius]